MPVPLVAAIARLGASNASRAFVRRFIRQAAESLAKEVLADVGKQALSVSVQLDLEALKRLKGKNRKAVYIAAGRAAKPAKAAVVANAERIRRFGYLAKSIGSKTKLYAAAVATIIGPKMSFVRGRKKATKGKNKGTPRKHRPYLYAWLLERGTNRSRAKPFLRPAWESEGANYYRILSAEIEAELAKLMDKG